MKKLKIFIPLTLTYEVFFLIIVLTGAFAYFTLIVLITNKMKSIFSPERTGKIIKVLGYVLIMFSLYFMFFAIKTLFFYQRLHN
jgi:hypothetical protein